MKIQSCFQAFLVLLVLVICRSAPPTEEQIEDALLIAREINLLKMELSPDTRETTSARCPLSLAHGKRTTSTPKEDLRVNNALLATRILLKDGKHSLEDLSHESVREVFTRVNGDSCNVATAPKPEDCPNTPYRSADGSCNNKRNPEWGMAGRQQERVLKNDYEDGLGLPRVNGIDGTPLPNAREISNIVNKNPSVNATFSNHLTLHAMGFGQFLDHDLILSSEQSVVSDCCDNTISDALSTDNCFNIIIGDSANEDSDIFVPGYCMEVKRTAPVLCPDFTTRTPVRQQKNAITSFVDASNVYGSSDARQTELRETDSGRMKTEGGTRPPNGNNADCILTEPNEHCTAAGDARVNVVPSLTSYHYMFIKEHNRIANFLKEFYPGDNNKVFEETRRIVIAIMQHIVYDEYLPAFFSPDGITEHNILSGPYTYDETKNPTVFNSFGISFRLGHTWISQVMALFDAEFNPRLDIPGAIRPTEETFNNPDMTYMTDAFAELQFWLQAVPSPETDRQIEEAVRSRLFLDAANNIAFDLAALNIQRGREHGVPSYSEFRKWCGLGDVDAVWKPVGKSGLVDHTLDAVQVLRQAGYKSPRDIDLWVGGISERPKPSGSIGPTFECIVGRMFNRLKFGDRFWYQNSDARFTPEQQNAIRSYSFARLLCNSFPFNQVNHPNAFRIDNARTLCADIPDLDLNAFRPPPPPPPPRPKKQQRKSFESELEELLDALEEQDQWK